MSSLHRQHDHEALTALGMAERNIKHEAELTAAWVRWAIKHLPRELRNAAAFMWYDGQWPHPIDIEATMKMQKGSEP